MLMVTGVTQEGMMAVTRASEPQRKWLVGPGDGADRLLLHKGDYRAGARVGLHIHDGEEAHLVLHGTVRFTVDGAQRECGAGEAAFAPAGRAHGFIVLADAAMVTIREQRLGTRVIVIDADGSRREVEVFRNGPPWSKEPPPGAGLTPDEDVEALYETTYHLL
jgi:quercetin dioxygenase-like cupin family protein